MLKVGDNVYRNIQEQVEENKKQIEALKTVGQTLSSFGIKVIGNVPTESELPDPAGYIGSYGDAYLIGSAEPYQMAIYTRPYGDDPIPQWVNIGQFPAIGEQGPQGVQGPAGNDGASINVYSGETTPVIQGNETENDLYIKTAIEERAIYVFKDGHWNYVVSLIGEQGPQGVQGPAGPAGDTINIVAKLDSTSLLPTNFENVPKNTAYLIKGANDIYHIWVILGQADDKSTWIWSDGGEFASESALTFIDSDEIVFDREGDQISATLNNNISSDIQKALKVPMVAPSEEKLVGIGTNNAQMNIAIGDGLTLEDNVLSASGGGSSGGGLVDIWTPQGLTFVNLTTSANSAIGALIKNTDYKIYYIRIYTNEFGWKWVRYVKETGSDTYVDLSGYKFVGGQNRFYMQSIVFNTSCQPRLSTSPAKYLIAEVGGAPTLYNDTNSTTYQVWSILATK